MNKKINIAVIGVGHLGQHHARIYNDLDNVNLLGIVDTNEEQLKTICERLNTKGYKSYKDIPEKIDAVSLAVPTKYHYDIALDLLNDGINVLIEKPITETTAQAEELVKKAQEKNLIIQVGHIERFNPAMISLRETLTHPQFIEVHRLAPYKARSTDVGVVLDLMIHDIDIIFSLVNSEIKDIKACGVCVLTNREDIANARLEFENGCVANVTASRISAEELRKIRIFQDDAYISIDYKDQNIKAYTKANDQIIPKEIPTEKKEPLKAELESFVECIINKEKPIVTGEHGKRALEAAVAIVEQIHQKK